MSDKPPTLPRSCRFLAGELAQIKSTTFSFVVGAVSDDGETLTTRDGVDYGARYCQYPSPPARRPRRASPS